jgi:ferredoxin
MDSKHAARLHIDWTACDGRGLCTELLPELLDRDEWGYPMPRDGGPNLVIPPDLYRHARRAVDQCPRRALALSIAGTGRPGQRRRAPAAG